MSHNMTGVEWVVDAAGCDTVKLKCLTAIEDTCDQIIADLDLKVVGKPQSHQFPEPGGVTLLYLLSESHLAAHTYPEHGIATFNLYCCRRRNDWAWQQHLAMALNARHVNVRSFDRGNLAASSRWVIPVETRAVR